jgi:hypothetical protein
MNSIKEQARRIFELSDLYAYGRDKHHKYCKDTVQSHLNPHPLCRSKQVWPLTIKMVEDSLKNGRNLYLTNKEGLKEILICVDIDADTDKFKDHVCAFACEHGAKSLCQTYPGAVHEPSTRGIGQNVWMRLDTEGWSAQDINERLRHLEAWLNLTIPILHGPGIKRVEIKRTVTSHAKDGKWGALARVPGVLPDFRDHAQLKISRIQIQKELPAKTGGSGFKEAFQMPSWDYKKAQAYFKDLSYYCMAYHHEATGGRKLFALDFQIALIALSVIAQKPNEDHQLPTELVKWVWQRVARKLGVERAFDVNRWKAIRNTLSDCQMLKWINNKYWFSKIPGQTGKAMQWHLLPEFTYTPTTINEESVICNKLLPVKEGYTGPRPLLWLNGRSSDYDLVGAMQKVDAVFAKMYD